MDFMNRPEILKFILNINNRTANIAKVPKLVQTPYGSMVSIFQFFSHMFAILTAAIREQHYTVKDYINEIW